MEVVQIINRRSFKKVLENFYIYKEIEKNNQN
jgi:hypothetical protein